MSGFYPVSFTVVRFIHVLYVVVDCSFSFLYTVLLCEYSKVYLSYENSYICGIFLLYVYGKQMNTFLFHIYLGVELLGYYSNNQQIYIISPDIASGLQTPISKSV